MMLLREATIRYTGKKIGVNPKVIHTGKDIVGVLRAWELHLRITECVVAVLLNTAHKIIAIHEVSSGTLDSVTAIPRDVFRAAIMTGAVSLIVAHNHPSGNPFFSPADVTLTERLEKAGKLIGIPLLDHIVLGEGENEYTSALALGLL